MVVNVGPNRTATEGLDAQLAGAFTSVTTTSGSKTTHAISEGTMAIEIKVSGGFEFVAEVEDLVTLKTTVCIRVYVLCDGKTAFEGFRMVEVPND